MTVVLLLEVLLFSGIFFVSQKSFLFSQKNVQSLYPAAETLLFSQFFHQEETLLFPIVSIRLQQFLIYRIRTSRLLVYMGCSIHSRLTDLPLHGTHTGQIVLFVIYRIQLHLGWTKIFRLLCKIFCSSMKRFHIFEP